MPDAARLPVAALAAATAGYSAFLFGQAEGRDFWQSRLVLPHLVVSAFVAGCAALLLASIAWPGTVPLRGPVLIVPLVVFCVFVAFMVTIRNWPNAEAVSAPLAKAAASATERCDALM